jgi:uncharacterized membrane protein SpoIIM required for sporulation
MGLDCKPAVYRDLSIHDLMLGYVIVTSILVRLYVSKSPTLVRKIDLKMPNTIDFYIVFGTTGDLDNAWMSILRFINNKKVKD